MRKTYLLVPALAIALSGCFIVSRPANGRSSQPVASEPRNHGQERSQEVHERNAERKAEHDAAKADKKK